MSPDRMHASGNKITTAELASILEGKYGLISSFSEFVSPKLYNRIEKYVFQLVQKQMKKEQFEREINKNLGQWLQNEWRNYINSQEHRITTKAARDENRVPFVETGDYFKSIIVSIGVKM